MYELNNDSLEEIEKSPIACIKFFAVWCGPCKLLGNGAFPRLVEANANVSFAECDADEQPDILSSYHIKSLPTVVVLKAGEEIGRIEGLKLQADYQTLIDAAITPL